LKRLSERQVENGVSSFLACLRSALLPIEKQTMLVIGRSVLRTEDKVDLLLDLFEQYIIRREKETKETLKEEPGWHLKHRYALTGNFTGREAEQETLTEWLNEKDEPLFILRALGGFGKSALTWHWLLNKVDRSKWKKALWWSFYEGDASFQNFLADALKYLLGEDVELPSAPRLQVEMLLKALEEKGILLILDGFERALRAYSSMSAAYQEDDEDKKYDERDLDCVSPAADDFLRGLASSKGIIQAKVLMTTRLRPRAVEGRNRLLGGCLEKELLALSKKDTIAYFLKQGIQGTRGEIESVCDSYGYHPLTLSILAGYILGNRKKPNDISVAKELNITEDIIQNKSHVLEVAYNSLSPEEGKLLSTIACFRSPTSYEALQSITDSPLPEGGQGEGESKGGSETRPYTELDNQLKQLETQGLLHWDKATNKYDLHPIVRRYAYECLTAPDRTAAHTRLRGYFEAVDVPQKIESLNDLTPVIELYHHMVKAEQFDEAIKLLRQRLVPDPLYYQFGAFQLMIGLERALFPNGEDRLPILQDEGWRAWLLQAHANAYSMIGEFHRAASLFKMHNELRENAGNTRELARGLGNMAYMAQFYIGALGDAVHNLHRMIDLYREIEDEGQEAVGHQELGRNLAYRGFWAEAKKELLISQKVFGDMGTGRTNYGSVNWAYCSIRSLLIARDTESIRLKSEYYQKAIEHASRALELADERAQKKHPYPVDFMRAYWLLGAAFRENKEADKANKNLAQALRICREINMTMFEADILLENSKLFYAQNEYEKALGYAQEALTITERSGYVLQGADVNLWLAELALAGLRLKDVGDELSDEELAKEYAEEALKLAHCEDGPPYHYKVAYEEAQALLEKLKE
jgi:tetratricopeptide (TPR) repeat protein